MTTPDTRSNIVALRDGITVSLTALADFAVLGEKWRELEQRSTCTFFQSWTWIGTWLSELPKSTRLCTIEVLDGDRLIGLGVIGARTLVRHWFVRSRALLLHETGAKGIDRITIEYNSVLAESGREREVVGATIRCLKETHVAWDELLVSGMEARTFEAWRAAVERNNWTVFLRQESNCSFVDLDLVRDRGGDYLSLLSSNTRQQIRRSIKAYEKLGKLSASVAPSREASVEYLHELQALHDVRWEGKGKEGAFSNEFTRRFHDRLVLEGGGEGAVQMLRVTAGEEVVGYLYNFVRDGYIYFYQSGFKYSEDPKLRPGMVCHYLAVMHNLQAGHRIYDFMAGPQRYKQSLATADAKMYWFSAQKPRLSFAAERLLKRLKGAIRRPDAPPSA